MASHAPAHAAAHAAAHIGRRDAGLAWSEPVFVAVPKPSAPAADVAIASLKYLHYRCATCADAAGGTKAPTPLGPLPKNDCIIDLRATYLLSA